MIPKKCGIQISITRSYLDRDHQWQRTSSFTERDLPHVSRAADWATQEVERLRARQSERSEESPVPRVVGEPLAQAIRGLLGLSRTVAFSSLHTISVPQKCVDTNPQHCLR